MKPICSWLPLVLLGGMPMLSAQTLVDLRTQSKSIDFTSAASTKPFQTGTTLPTTCSVGATFFNSAAAAGHNLYGCTATNTWTLLGANLWFGGGAFNTGDCAQFNSAGNIVDAGGPCTSATMVTMTTPFTVAGSLMVSAGPGRVGVASTCTNTGGTLNCPGGFTGSMTWPAGSGTNTRQILAPAGLFTSNFNYVWADAVPSTATLMKIGTPSAGAASLGPAIPDTDYVTPSGTGTLQNKTFDGTVLFSNYLPWTQISTPSAPAAGYLRVYAKAGGGVCWLNSFGTETCAGGTVPDPGATGLIVETSPGVTANRTITAGSSNISVTNGSGSGGNPTVDIASTVNFSGKTTSPVQVGVTAGIPGTCTAGQLYFASDGVPGRQLQTCTTANTWAPVAYGQGSVNPATCSVGQAYFNISAPAGQNLVLCTATNTWTQLAGAINSVFGRTGAVTAQSGDYSYSQISSTPAALPPNGAASGDLSGSYPNPVVAQVNGAAIPATGVLKANASHQIVSAISGTDYMGPATAVQAAQMPALTGDCVSTAGTVATTCSKTNGTAFAASATTDTTNAGNISSGTLNAGRLPATAMQTNQSNTVSGGTQDFHAAAHTLPMATGTSASLPSTCTVGEMYFATNATAGLNQFYCTVSNVWTQQSGGTGAVSSVFGRTGVVSAQSGDYTYSQISSTPAALPPNGMAAGDLSGSYPNPRVAQVNGAAVPTSGMLKANGSGQMVAAVSGTDYAPATGTAAVLKGSGSGGFSSAAAADIVNLFSACSGSQYLGADGGCHTSSGGTGSGYVVLTTGSGAPSANCAAPSSSNLAVYLDTTNGDEWWCYATNNWKKTLSVTGSGPLLISGSTGATLAGAASGAVNCGLSTTTPNTLQCEDNSSNVTQMEQLVASGSLSLASTSISSGSCQTVTAGSVNSATASGVATTDVISFTPNGSIKTLAGFTPGTSGGLTVNAYPTAGYVNFDVCNWSGGAIAPGAVTLNWQVRR